MAWRLTAAGTGTGAAGPAGTSEDLLRLAVQAAPSGILIVDGDGTIVLVNEALTEMFGCRADDIVGKSVEVLIPDRYAAAHRQHRMAFGATPTRRTMGADRSFEAVRRDGSTFPVEIGLRPCPVGGRQLVVATLIDITERKAIDDRLRRYEEQLEDLVDERTRELVAAQQENERVMRQLIQAEKLASIGTLVSGIGHEINNPLYAILGMAEAIRDGVESGEHAGFGAEIVEYCRQIAATVRNLSHYAKPHAEDSLRPVDVDNAIEAAIGLIRRTIQGDTIEIVHERGAMLPVLAKPEEIQQVLFNVIRNGVQACGERGSLTILSSIASGVLTVRIRDTGHGITEEAAKRIFDPFFTTKGPDEGEGLGLYIVRQIVTRYGGSIDFTSKRDQGTTFVIEFPVIEQEQKRAT